MRQHADLSAMVGLMTEHVAQHFRANRPGLRPSVSQKLHDEVPTAQRFGEHLLAASGTLGQSCTGLLRSATRTVHLSRNVEVRRREPDPLAANIVHVREDRRDGAGVAGRFRSPNRRVKMFDKNLVDSIVGDKDLDGGWAKLRIDLALTRGHGALLLDP